MESLCDLNSDEIDILLQECEQEIKDALAKLALIMIERDNLRRKIRIWREEADVLELLKSGVDFHESLIEIKPATLRTIQRRFNEAVIKYNNVFAGVDKLKINDTKTPLQELIEETSPKSRLF